MTPRFRRRPDAMRRPPARRRCARFENRTEPAWAIHEVLVDVFIASHPVTPQKLVLDFDATDDADHGHRGTL